MQGVYSFSVNDVSVSTMFNVNLASYLIIKNYLFTLKKVSQYFLQISLKNRGIYFVDLSIMHSEGFFEDCDIIHYL